MSTGGDEILAIRQTFIDEATQGLRRTQSALDRLKRGNEGVERSARQAARGMRSVGDRRTVRNVQEIARSFQGLRRSLIGLAAAAGIGLGFAQLSSSLRDTFRQSIALGDQFDKLSQRTGVSVETLSTLGFAAERSGGSITDVANGLRRMLRVLDQARSGRQIAIDLFARLGISREQINSIRSIEQLLPLVADGFRQVGDSAALTQISFDLLNESGPRLIPLFVRGSQGLRDFDREARRVGASLRTGFTRGAAGATDAITDFNKAQEALGRTVAESSLEPLTQLLTALTNLSKVLRESGSASAIGGGFAAIFKSLTTGINTLVAALDKLSREDRQFIRDLARGLTAGASFGVLSVPDAEGRAQVRQVFRAPPQQTEILQRIDRFREQLRQRAESNLFTREQQQAFSELLGVTDDFNADFQRELAILLGALDEYNKAISTSARRIDIETDEAFRIRGPQVGGAPIQRFRRSRDEPREFQLPPRAQPVELDIDTERATERAGESLRGFQDTMRATADIVFAVSGRIDTAFNRIISALNALVTFADRGSRLFGGPGLFGATTAQRPGRVEGPVDVNIESVGQQAVGSLGGRLGPAPTQGQVGAGGAGGSGFGLSNILGALGAANPFVALASSALSITSGRFEFQPAEGLRRLIGAPPPTTQADEDAVFRREVQESIDRRNQQILDAGRQAAFSGRDISSFFPEEVPLVPQVSERIGIRAPSLSRLDEATRFDIIEGVPLTGPTIREDIVRDDGRRTEFAAAGGVNVQIQAIDTQGIADFFETADTRDIIDRSRRLGGV